MKYNPSNIVLPPLALTRKLSRITRGPANLLPYKFADKPFRTLDRLSPRGRRVFPFCPGIHRTAIFDMQLKLRGRVKCQVIDDKGRVARSYPWEENLIYNLGLDTLCDTATLVELMQYAVSGDGTGDTKRDSGAITASQTSTTVTASAGFFVAGDVANMIKWDSGEEARITSFTSTTQVEVTPAQSVGSGQFTVHETNDPGMSAEHARTQTYLGGAGNCDTSVSGSVVTLRRTYDFPTEGAGITIREIGFSNTSTVAANLFNRIFLASPVALLTGQALRVVYDLDVTVSPTSSSAITAAISGWPVAPATTTDGDQAWGGVCLSGPNPSSGANSTASASSGVEGAGLSMEPSELSDASIDMNSSSAALPAFNATHSSLSGTSILNTVVSGNTYNPFDFFREKRINLAVGSGNATNIRRLILGGAFAQPAYAANHQGFTLLFDEDQTKANTHTLELIFRITAGRTLTN